MDVERALKRWLTEIEGKALTLMDRYCAGKLKNLMNKWEKITVVITGAVLSLENARKFSLSDVGGLGSCAKRSSSY